MKSTAISTAKLEHVEVEAEEGVHQSCLLLLGEVLRQGGVEAAGEDGLELVDQIFLDDRSGAVCHPDEEEWVVAAPVLLTIAKDPTRSPNNTFKLLCVPVNKNRDVEVGEERRAGQGKGVATQRLKSHKPEKAFLSF